MRFRILAAALLLPLVVAAADDIAGRVDDARVQAERNDGSNWLVSHGTVMAEHFSPLSQISRGSIQRLGLDWYLDIPTGDGLAATPIVVDGVAYLSGAFSLVWAVDLRSGKLLWSYDPQVKISSNSSSISWGARVNRGVAVWHGKVIVGTADCRLIALHAGTGEVAWSQQVCDNALGYKITAAPMVGGNLVFTGNGGSESGFRNRGYVTAHDITTGREVWRFYTVPSGTPEDENDPVMKMAAATWSGEAWKEFGGGGSAWEGMSYDASTGLLIFGTAGALPYIHQQRSPGGGDNLFTESVVALHAETGQYAWHYQTVPGDSWEYNATMNIVLADLELDGRLRQVAMIAPKNGFFYVLDRRTGELLAADPYTRVNWASGIDLESGRPLFSDAARYWEHPGERMFIWPNSWGAHSWNPMAYHPGEKLVYIPTIDLPDELIPGKDGEYGEGRVAWPAEVDGKPHVPSRLLAWDPVENGPKWAVNHELPFNGGVLATGGGLVFQGTATGRVQAFDANSGERLWSVPVGSAISAAPVSYALDGVQYLLVATGGGGGLRMVYPEWAASAEAHGPSRLLAFRLDSAGAEPPDVSLLQPLPEPPAPSATAEQVERGGKLFEHHGCKYCHGADARAWVGGSVPDLRYLSVERHLAWNGVVIGGALAGKGMIGFEMTAEEAEAIRQWVLHRAWEDYRSSPASTDTPPRALPDPVN